MSVNTIKGKRLETKMKKTPKRIFKTSLALTLILFAFTMSSPYSFFQFVKPVEAAGTLTSMAILPTNNIVNARSTYDIIFKTATTGTIKTIQMEFASSFDVSAATRVIERNGIGSGSLSAQSSTTLIYTVSSPVSVAAGTTIRLEIGRIANSDTAGFFKVSIATENTTPIIIDGPTLSPSFPIKDITGNDVSPAFMIRKTLQDDTAGHSHGWDPDDVKDEFIIKDPDISGSETNIFVQAMDTNMHGCHVIGVDTSTNNVFINCESPVVNGVNLHYEITKLPANIVTSSLSVSSSESSSTHSSQYESLRAHDQIASEFP